MGLGYFCLLISKEDLGWLCWKEDGEFINIRMLINTSWKVIMFKLINYGWMKIILTTIAGIHLWRKENNFMMEVYSHLPSLHIQFKLPPGPMLIRNQIEFMLKANFVIISPAMKYWSWMISQRSLMKTRIMKY